MKYKSLEILVDRDKAWRLAMCKLLSRSLGLTFEEYLQSPINVDCSYRMFESFLDCCFFFLSFLNAKFSSNSDSLALLKSFFCTKSIENFRNLSV